MGQRQEEIEQVVCVKYAARESRKVTGERKGRGGGGVLILVSPSPLATCGLLSHAIQLIEPNDLHNYWGRHFPIKSFPFLCLPSNLTIGFQYFPFHIDFCFKVYHDFKLFNLASENKCDQVENMLPFSFFFF